jgi:hypothetical protein
MSSIAYDIFTTILREVIFENTDNPASPSKGSDWLSAIKLSTTFGKSKV